MEELLYVESDTTTTRGYFHEILEIFSSVILLVTISNIFTCDFTRNIVKPSKDYVILRRVEELHVILQLFEGLEM